MTTEITPALIVARSYQSADLPACHEIFTAGHLSHNTPMICMNYILQTDMSDIEKNYLQVPNGHWWVAVSLLSIAHPSYYNELPEEERDQICEIRRMFVATDAQRAGVGSKLISTVIDFAREKGYRQLHLTTLTNMDKACAFYEKNGFTKGQIDKTPFDVSLKNIEDLQEVYRNPPKPVIFKPGDVIPQEELRLMKMPSLQSKYVYLQYYSMML